MKRIKKVIPAAFVLSTALFVAPGFSSADTNTTNVGNLPIVVDSQGPKAPITAAQAQQDNVLIPPVPTGPYQEFPYEYHSSTQYGDLIDYVYIDVYAKQSGSQTNDYTNAPFLYIAPDGTRVNTVGKYTFNYTAGKLAYTIGIPVHSELGKEVLADTKLQKSIYWKLIDSNIVDKNSGYHWEKSVTSGISKANSLGFSLTVGFELGFGEFSKFTSSLTTSFDSTTTITDETTTTKTFDFNPKPDYAYDQYRTALYQQLAKYSVKPGSNLQAFINAGNTDPALSKGFEFKLREAYDYPVDVLLALTSK